MNKYIAHGPSWLTVDPASKAVRAAAPLPSAGSYDLETMYVECHQCGKPVLWEAGKTTELLLAAGVNVDSLDASCLIVSEGCPVCRPEERGGFVLTVARISGFTRDEFRHMGKTGGNA